MSLDDLNTPLGQKKRKKGPKLPVAGPQILAGVLGLFGIAVVAWAIFGNDPLGGEPTAVPHRNRSPHGSYRDYYSAAARDKVGEVYAADVEAFGYTF